MRYVMIILLAICGYTAAAQTKPTETDDLYAGKTSEMSIESFKAEVFRQRVAWAGGAIAIGGGFMLGSQLYTLTSTNEYTYNYQLATGLTVFGTLSITIGGLGLIGARHGIR